MSNAERFAGGAIGEPGNRVFMLELVVAGAAVAYVIEKIQVQALAEEALRLLKEHNMIGTGLSLEPGGVHEDTPVAYRIGGLQLSLDDESEMATLIVHSTDEEDPIAEYELTPAQLDAFAREALIVVGSGRPACPRCGLPMESDGHNCPHTNGDLRDHRP
jgi:uncharacterized repeat protein (TIGR03847 family)